MRGFMNGAILLMFVSTMVPMHVVAVPINDVGSDVVKLLPPVRELGAQELAMVRGGVSNPVGGGGKNGGSSQPVKVTRFVSPEVPNVYQRIQYDSRSDHYCGFAVALMLQYWVDYHVPSRSSQEFDLGDMDRNAQHGHYVWPIDVVWNGGFLYSGGSTDAIDWQRSKAAASSLFRTCQILDEPVLTVQPEDRTPSSGLTTGWNRIHGHDDWDDFQRLPTIIVTKTSATTLHYSLIVGTEKEGSDEKFWINDPWEARIQEEPRASLANEMAIHWGQYYWVGRVMDGNGIFGFLTEHANWR